MRPITRSCLKFLAGFAGVLVVSAFLAPWLHTFLPFKFDRILRRLLMIGAIGLGVLLVRERREMLGNFGLRWEGRKSFRMIAIGFLAGTMLVFGLSLLQWALGARFWQPAQTDGWHWIGFVFKGLGGGLIIGAIEEIFFRGFLFAILKDLWNGRVSLVVTNLIYALVHFFPKGKVMVGPDPTVWDSLRIYAAIVPSSGELIQILPAVLGLFLFGLILSFLFLHYGSLFPNMGVHAGCVFGIKLNRRFVPEIADRMNWISGTKNIYDGWVGIGVLAVLCVLLGRVLRIRLKENE